MTDKGKQIEEMAEFIHVDSSYLGYEEDALQLAEELYNAGYRKQTNDVAPRAEVARVILNEVDNLLWRHKMRGFINLDLILNDIVKLKKKYTEELR